MVDCLIAELARLREKIARVFFAQFECVFQVSDKIPIFRRREFSVRIRDFQEYRGGGEAEWILLRLALFRSPLEPLHQFCEAQSTRSVIDMARIDISQLPDQSRIWIFGISPALDPRKSSRLLAVVDDFLDGWAAHGQAIVSARDLLYGSLLIIAVDQRSETSGCSIDRMFGLLQQLERELGIAILDPSRIFYRRADGSVHATSRPEFRESGDSHTMVFDTLSERLGELRNGSWERRARDSWHRTLLDATRCHRCESLL